LYAQEKSSSANTTDLYKGLGDMGLTTVGLAADSIRGSSQKEEPEGANFQANLDRIAENYKTTLAGERGAVKLLNGTLEIVLIGSDVMTEGGACQRV
jgi:hypothetical protein